MKIREDSYYHIYNRGNNKGLIFFEEDNYHYFLHKLEFYVIPHCKVFAYCLMPNHFHIFVQVINKKNFERGIKNFFISYSKSVNKRYNRVGGLFQGRYKAKEVNENSYITSLIIYIHQNPLVAGLVSNMEDYDFSSYLSYFHKAPSFLTKDFIIRWFGNFESFVRCHSSYSIVSSHAQVATGISPI